MTTEATTETTTISVRVPIALKTRVEELAQTTGRTKEHLMAEALLQYIDREQWQMREIEEALREADAHPDALTAHEDAVAETLAQGMVTQEALNHAEQEVSLEEIQRAQQMPP